MKIGQECFLCVSVVMMMVTAQTGAQSTQERVLYRKSLSEGRELVVLLQPIVPPSVMKDLVEDRLLAGVVGVCSVGVEVRSRGNPPLRFGSGVGFLQSNSEADQILVLDLITLPNMNRLVMVTAGPGSTIAVRDVNLYSGPPRVIPLQAGDWSLLAAAIPAPPGRLSAKLDYNEKEQRVEVEVTDFLQDTKRHTHFEQKGSEWEFVRVKQWEEKVPATNPAAP